MRAIGTIIFGLLLLCFGWGWAIFIFLLLMLPFAIPLLLIGLLVEWVEDDRQRR
jgi:MFS family permease